jgi:hypothetical protein
MAKGSFMGIHLDKTTWLLVGLGGGIALYLMLLGRDTGIKPADMIIREVGNDIGLEGAGKGILPDFLTPEEKHSMFAEDGDYGDMDITVA